MEMKDLTNQVVVITGASSGIGLAAAETFVGAGCNVVLLGRSSQRLEQAVTKVSQSKRAGTIISKVLDVADESAVMQTFSEIEQELERVDILINNAGIGFSTDLASCSTEDYRRMMETNVSGVFFCTRTVLPGMKSRQQGNIINVSSGAGKSGNPAAPVYCASKHALNGYTDGLRQQVAGDNIRVSLISPGPVDTAYWDGREVDRSKFLRPEEVADTIFFIATRPEGVVVKDIDLTAQR